MLSASFIEKCRLETPGTVHNIHFNNAGASLMPHAVIDAVKNHIELESEIGGYEAASLKSKEIKQFYVLLAKMVKTTASNIAFANSATTAYNIALSSIPFEKGDVLLTTNEDYVSNQIALLQLCKSKGVQLIRVKDKPTGGFDPNDMERLIKETAPKLVAVTHIPTGSGLIQEVEAAGQLCDKYGCYYLVDACQSAGQLDLDVERLQCDFLTATFRKFMRGPRGAGFLYASQRVLDEGLEPVFLDLHSANWVGAFEYVPKQDAKRFESWERSYALVLGAKAAVEYALQIGMPMIEARVIKLASMLRQGLSTLGRIEVADRGERLGGIVTANVEGWKPELLHQALMNHHINCSISHKRAAVIHAPHDKVPWALRLSPHYYNTEEEIESVVETLGMLLQ